MGQQQEEWSMAVMQELSQASTEHSDHLVAHQISLESGFYILKTNPLYSHYGLQIIPPYPSKFKKELREFLCLT